MNLRSNLKQGKIKCELFDFPRELYLSTFNAFKMKSTKISFEEYADNRDNFEFLKTFNKLNLQSATVTVVNELGDEL